VTPEQRIQYARTVWSCMEDRWGAERIMSPAEWDLLRRWMDRDVPLRVVLRGLADTVGNGRGLLYYERCVEETIERWRRTLA